jgi:hypothetical protein
MTASIRNAVMAVVCAIGLAAAAPPPTKQPAYVLEGYRFAGLLTPANTAGIIAKLKHQPGARVTGADIAADAAIFATELKARHLKGRFLASSEENRGRIWVTFGLWHLIYPDSGAWSSRQLESQHFEGVSGIPTSALLRATQLKPGDALSPERIDSAKDAIEALLAKTASGTKLTIKIKIQTRPNNKAALTWVIGGPKAVTATGAGKGN